MPKLNDGAVTITSWSAPERLQRALQIRLFSLTNYISQNSLPGLIITDHILYLIHLSQHPVSLAIYTIFIQSLTVKSCTCYVACSLVPVLIS